LLDRFAAASPVPISSGPGAFAYVLAAMLVALKVSGTQRDLERAKRLVIEASGTPRPWAAVRKAELQILRRLGFRACTPNGLDFLERLVMQVLEGSSVPEGLDPETRTKCSNLARLLLELGLVHEPETLYGSSGHPPLAFAFAALLLALRAFRAPASCTEALRQHMALLEGGEAIVGDLAESMRTRWQTEERKCAISGTGSAVLEKWKRRMGSIGVSVPSSGDMRLLMPEAPKKAAVEVEDSELARRLRIKQAASPLRIRDPSGQPSTTILAPPTVVAVHRMSSGAVTERSSAALIKEQLSRDVRDASSSAGGPAASEPPSSATITAPCSARPSAALGGTSTLGLGSVHSTAPASARFLPSQPTPAADTSENVSSGVEDMRDTKGARKEADATATSSEPLVELTHVLNMVHPTSNRPSALDKGATNGTSLSKSKPPSVASELLVSSALRLAWPPDRRKGVDLSVAAGSCREAAAVLEEAALYLRNTAANLDSGNLQPHELKAKKEPGSETKRRKTFGGPSPTRGTSPSAGTESARGASSTTAPIRGIRV